MPALITAERRAIHSARGYTHTDGQYTLKATPGSTITSFKAGRIFKRTAATTYLEAYVDDNGTNSRLRIDTVTAGTRANLATENLAARVSNGTSFWVRGRIEGNVVTAEYFTTEPYPMLTPTNDIDVVLTGANATNFGTGVGGYAGWSWIPQHASATLDDYRDEPYTYSLGTTMTVAANTMTLYGVPGTAPAAVDVETSTVASANGLIMGWGSRGVESYVWNGAFEVSNGGWAVAAVANIHAAATSITRVTTAAKYGAASGEIVCPATADSGASFRMYRRFKKGVTYTLKMWVQSAAATTQVRAEMGNSAANDVSGAGTAVALSTAWQEITQTWTPTADRNDAHAAVTIAAATATTFRIDGVMVYEGTTAPTSSFQSQGQGGRAPLGLIEAESYSQHTGSWVLTASSDYSGGQAMVDSAVSNGDTPHFRYRLDPALLASDDFSKSVTIEFWARYAQGSAAYSPTFSLTAYPVSASGATLGASIVTDTGSKTVEDATTSLTRVGAITFPVGTPGSAVWEVQFQIVFPASGTTGSFLFDYLLAVPARQRIAGNIDLNGGGANPVAALVQSDLTTYTREYPGPATVQTAGIGGQRVEFDPGTVTVAHKLATGTLTDDGTTDGGGPPAPGGQFVHFSVHPRFHITRSS